MDTDGPIAVGRGALVMALLKLDKLGARERVGLGLALVCMLVLLVDRLVVGMVAGRIQAVAAQAAAESKELDYNRGVLKTQGPIAAEYARIEALLANELSDAEAIDKIKGQVDDLARASGVELISMEHRAPLPAEGYTEYVIEIRKFEAPMDHLLDFLHDVWQTPDMMRLRKLTIAPGADDTTVEGSAIISTILIPRAHGGSEE